MVSEAFHPLLDAQSELSKSPRMATGLFLAIAVIVDHLNLAEFWLLHRTRHTQRRQIDLRSELYANQRIYKASDPSGPAYVMLSGAVLVTLIDEDGQEVIFSRPRHGARSPMRSSSVVQAQHSSCPRHRKIRKLRSAAKVRRSQPAAEENDLAATWFWRNFHSSSGERCLRAYACQILSGPKCHSLHALLMIFGHRYDPAPKIGRFIFAWWSGTVAW